MLAHLPGRVVQNKLLLRSSPLAVIVLADRPLLSLYSHDTGALRGVETGPSGTASRRGPAFWPTAFQLVIEL